MMGTEPEKRGNQTTGKLLAPPQYKIMLKDNGSDPLFIWDIICGQFNMRSEVTEIVAEDIRTTGVSIIIPFTAEVAEHKVREIVRLSRYHGQRLEAAYDVR